MRAHQERKSLSHARISRLVSTCMVFMYCMHALENIQSKADDKKPIEYIIGEYVGVSGLSYSLLKPSSNKQVVDEKSGYND